MGDVKSIDRNQVLRVLKISDSTLKRLIRKGEFPKPIKISPRVHAWFEEDVINYIVSRSGSRD